MRELFGYYTYSVSKEVGVHLINACLMYGVEMQHVREGEENIFFRIPITRARHADAVFQSQHIAYQKGTLSGILGGVKRSLRSPGLIIGLVLSLVVYLWLMGMIWEVRVISPGDIDEDRVIQILSECGLEEGTRLSQIDVDKLVASYLINDPETAYAAIHIRGVVAEIELIPKDKTTPQVLPGAPCNIVALEDAVITDITVYAGKALVKVGDVVRRGDILVSGIISDVGGTRLVHAAADIMGERRETIEVSVADSIIKNETLDKNASGIELRVFSHRFSFGDVGTDKVKELKQLYLFGMVRLPICITTSYDLKNMQTSVSLTEEQMEQLANERLSQNIAQLVSTGTLLAVTKTENKKDKTFNLTAEVVFESNIGKALAFDVENN